MDQVLCIFSINCTNSSVVLGGMLEPGAPLPLSSFPLNVETQGSGHGTSYTVLGWGMSCLWQRQADTAEKLVTGTSVFVGSHDLLRRLSHQTHKWPTIPKQVFRWSHVLLLWGIGWNLTQKSSEGGKGNGLWVPIGTYWRRKWQPTPVFLPGESQGREPRGLPSMGSHRVGHDWSNLAAAAAQEHIKSQTLGTNLASMLASTAWSVD